MSVRTVRYALDNPRIDGPLTLRVGEEVHVSGWALLEPLETDPPSVALEIVDAQSGIATRVETVRTSRPDVMARFGNRALMSGFESRLLVDGHPYGTRAVRLHLDEGPSAPPPIDLFSFAVAALPYEIDIRAQLAARFLNGAGLEIGALQRRLPIPSHCSVTYVDRMGIAELIAHYPELAGQPIQEPDLIDDGETLGKIGSATQAFVIANHFLEHCENPIQTVENFARVLADGGVLYMAVPDKRFTFDVDRPVTSYPVLAETYRTGYRADRVQLYSEWASYVLNTLPQDVDAVAQRLLHEKYSIHFNVWAVSDVLQFVVQSLEEFGVPMTLDWVVCSENEVIVILRKQTSLLQPDHDDRASRGPNSHGADRCST